MRMEVLDRCDIRRLRVYGSGVLAKSVTGTDAGGIAALPPYPAGGTVRRGCGGGGSGRCEAEPLQCVGRGIRGAGGTSGRIERACWYEMGLRLSPTGNEGTVKCGWYACGGFAPSRFQTEASVQIALDLPEMSALNWACSRLTCIGAREHLFLIGQMIKTDVHSGVRS
jgi:hypothetical protein